jgi:hypothetical protein
MRGRRAQDHLGDRLAAGEKDQVEFFLEEFLDFVFSAFEDREEIGVEV